MLENLNGIFVVGTCTKKIKDSYTNKEGKEQIAHRLKFDYMGGSYQVNVDDVIYTKAEEGMIYFLEIKAYTNEKMKGCIYLSNKDSKIFEITDKGLLPV